MFKIRAFRFSQLDAIFDNLHSAEASPPERLYHIVAINEKTGNKVFLTRYAMNHHESCTMLSKQSNRVPHVRIQLEAF